MVGKFSSRRRQREGAVPTIFWCRALDSSPAEPPESASPGSGEDGRRQKYEERHLGPACVFVDDALSSSLGENQQHVQEEETS